MGGVFDARRPLHAAACLRDACIKRRPWSGLAGVVTRSLLVCDNAFCTAARPHGGAAVPALACPWCSTIGHALPCLPVHAAMMDLCHIRRLQMHARAAPPRLRVLTVHAHTHSVPARHAARMHAHSRTAPGRRASAPSRQATAASFCSCRSHLHTAPWGTPNPGQQYGASWRRQPPAASRQSWSDCVQTDDCSCHLCACRAGHAQCCDPTTPTSERRHTAHDRHSKQQIGAGARYT